MSDFAKLSGKITLDSSLFETGIQRVMNSFQRVHDRSIKLNQTIELMKNAWAGFGNVASQAWDLAERGAKRADIEGTFKRLAQAQGRAAEDMLKQLQAATKGSLSQMQGMALSTQSMMAGMDFDQTVTAIQYIQRYSKAANKDFNQLVSTIMTGLARGSTLMLDDAGILIDQTSFLAQKSREYGRELTEIEKKSLLVSEAVAQMSRKMGALGDDTMTAYDRFQQLRATWENFKDFLGNLSLRLLALGQQSVDGWNLILKSLQLGVVNLRLSLEEGFGAAMSVIRGFIREALATLRNFSFSVAQAALESNSEAVQSIGMGFLNLTNALNAGIRGMIEAEEGGTGALRTQRGALVKELDELATAVDERWNVILGNLSSGPGSLPMFDLSASVGNTAAFQADKDAIERQREEVKRLQEQIAQTANTFDQLYSQVEQQEDELRLVGLEGMARDLEQVNITYERMLQRNPEFQNLIDLWRDKRVAVIEAEAAMKAAQQRADLLHESFGNLGNSLSASLTQALDDGNLKLRSILQSIGKELRGWAIGKTLHFSMEALFNSIMAAMYPQNPQYAKNAALAQQGALAMAPFASGSALAGMAHDGLDYIPRQGTWLLDKGERVVDKRTNEDLKDFLRRPEQAMNVQIVLKNESGENLKLSRQETQIDHQQVVVYAWLDAYQNNKHGLRTAMGG
ncbi:hypothetical protein [Desulfocurvibacter africanus]|uniref:hypothetical protein n=1 Tax=Desulfocurvibacter africanus TaxID=873 RepID=UPI000485928D|nr:hypothetical protein [Desulfocurvibacter africanus]